MSEYCKICKYVKEMHNSGTMNCPEVVQGRIVENAWRHTVFQGEDTVNENIFKIESKRKRGENMIEYSKTSTEIIKALLKTQEELPRVERTKEGYGYRYAPLNEILEKLIPLLSKNGLVLNQAYSFPDINKIDIVTRLTHTSGEFVKALTKGMAYSPMLSKKGNELSKMQSAGAAITYAKRYQLSALLGIEPDVDTDAANDPDTQIQKKYQNKYHVEKNETVNTKGADEKKKPVGGYNAAPEENKAVYSSIMNLVRQRIGNKDIFIQKEKAEIKKRADAVLNNLDTLKEYYKAIKKIADTKRG